MDQTSELVCSFCQKGQNKVEKIIAGPSVFICDECVLSSVRRILEATPPFPQQENLGCSFCGKPSDEVERLVGKNNIFICIDCVHLSVQALMHNTFAEPKVVEL